MSSLNFKVIENYQKIYPLFLLSIYDHCETNGVPVDETRFDFGPTIHPVA
jgi:hypothetical protein